MNVIKITGLFLESVEIVNNNGEQTEVFNEHFCIMQCHFSHECHMFLHKIMCK